MPIVWIAGHEAGTLDEWDGNFVFGGSASVVTSLDRTHSGTRSVKMTIDTTGVPLSPPRLFMAYYCAFDEARTGMSGSDVPFALGLTHVLHFAAMPQVVGGVSSIDMAFHGPPSLVPDNLADLQAARTAAGSTAKILLTIGGIESNDFFIEAVDNDRAQLISDIMAKVATHGYDGVDIDWENWTDDVVAYERITDFHAALGTALHAAGKILISSAWGYYVRPAAAAYWKAELFDTGLLDYQNLLLHGLVQPSITNQMVVHNAPSHSLSDYGTPAYLAAWDIALFQYIDIDGWPPDKIIAGLSFGAHFRWGTPGIMTSPSTSVGRGPRVPTDSWSGEGGIEPGAGGGDLYYLEIIDMPEYATSLFSDFAAGQVPFIGHTGATPAGDFFISFDDEVSLQNKMRVARNAAVAGMSVWNISMDFNPSGVGLAARHPLGFTVRQGLDELFTTSVECGAAVFREQELLFGTDRYCSAWYWFSEIHEPRVYWTIMDFTSQRVSPPADSPIIIIGVDNDGAGGSLHLHMFYNGDVLGATDVKYQQSVADLPVGQWVHIETFLHQAENDTGLFRLWQNGVQLLNVSGLRTRYVGGNQVWRVANFSGGLDPPIATVYVDDAVIALERIGAGPNMGESLLMANPLRITYVNHADDAVFSGISAVSSLPLSNLKTDDIRRVFRGTASSAAGPQVINVDLGAIKTVGCIALINCNLFAPIVTVELTLSTDDPSGVTGMTYSATVPGIPDPVYNTFVHFIEPQAEARYVLIWMQNIPVPPEAGRLVIGEAWSPSRDMRPGFEVLARDPSIRTESLGGNEFVDVRPRRRGYRFTSIALTEAEAQDQVDRLNRQRGIGRDILVCRDKDSDNLGRDTIWGLLAQPVSQRKTRSGYEIEVEVWARS